MTSVTNLEIDRELIDVGLEELLELFVVECQLAVCDPGRVRTRIAEAQT